MYILKIIDIKIRKYAHCGLYLRFMVLIGLISVRISLNIIVIIHEAPRNPPELGFERLTVPV